MSGAAHAHELPDDGTGQLDEVVAAVGAGEVVYLTRDGHRVAAVVPPAAAEAAQRQAAAEEVLTRMVARAGAPSLEHYRQVYDSLGIAWPGDDEVRRLYPVTA